MCGGGDGFLQRRGDVLHDVMLGLHPAQERPGALMLRVGDHRGGLALFDDYPTIHEYDVVGDLAGEPTSVINNPQHDRTRSFLRRMQSEHHAVEHVPTTLEEVVLAKKTQDLEEAE